MATKEYRRLPGTGTGLGTYTRLWYGMDHLLLVTSTNFSEDYKRFYYSDIQALIIRETKARGVWSLVWAALAGLFALVGYIPGRDDQPVWFSIAGFCLLVSVWSWLLGPTCICHVRTAIQTEPFPSLKRLRTARRVLARIRPLIEAAQGQLTPEEIQSKAAQPDQVLSMPQAVARPSTGETEPLRPYSSKAHLVLFWLAIADGPLTILYFSFYNNRWIETLSALLGASTVAGVIAALVKQRGTNLTGRLTALPWIILGNFAVSMFGALWYGIFLMARNPVANLSKVSSLEDSFLLTLSAVSTTISVFSGIVGLALLKEYRAQYLKPDSQPLPAAVETIDRS